MGIAYSAVEQKAAVRAAEMQRRYRARGGGRLRTVPDFIVGAHALLQCDGLITRDAAFFETISRASRSFAPKAG